MRFLHPPLLIFLLASLPVATALIECLNYRVEQGAPIPKAVRNPRCSTKAEYCVKITGSSAEGSQPFDAGRCEYPGECAEYGNGCFTRDDSAGKTEHVCCSNENFANHSSSNSVIGFLILFITLILLEF
ncbi:unnamed protein product [Caenorhabditis sp. 36 PRJEB53466]|nr:unnamed protein product [Caenorhabditis sp. 36 PRJEB53466]